MAIQFRPAVANDAVDCVRVRGRTRENAISEVRLASAGITAESWARDIEEGALPGFVCEAEGSVVGYCFGATDTGEVVVLALLPDFENRGIGRQLLDMVVRRLRRDGHRRLFLGCSPDASCRAHGFYRHLGWRSTGTFDRFGDEVLELVPEEAAMHAFATSADGVSLAYEAQGARRPAVVLVHGWSCDRTCWRDQMRALSKAHFVVALDLAGHGQSGRERREWTIASFAEDVASVVSALELRDVILVGHSMGANVVLEAAKRVGNPVRGLVWVDQYTQLERFPSESEVSTKLAPFYAAFAETTRSFVRRLFAASSNAALVESVALQMSLAPEDVALPALEATWNHGRVVPKLLEELGIPVVAINAQGVSDDAQALRSRGIRLILVPGVGHFPMLEAPEAFNACLSQAIDELARASPRRGRRAT